MLPHWKSKSTKANGWELPKAGKISAILAGQVNIFDDSRLSDND